MQSLEDRRLRSNPDLDFIAVADLSAKRRRALEANVGKDICGLLHHRRASSWEIALDHDTARLHHALLKPQVGRSVLQGQPPERRFRVLARLVCDQLLQVERDDGRFVDGIAAHPVLFGGDAEPGLSDRLDRLSRAALDHAAAVNSRSSTALARRLYTHNALPLTRRWHERLADVQCWLGLDRLGWPQRLSDHYVAPEAPSGGAPWLQWTRRGSGQEADRRRKIYVSPLPAQLAEVLAVVAETCRALEVPAFKVGATPFGVLRPDKLVVYPGSRTQLRRVAKELGRALDDVDAQGVPFTAPLGTGALLSWAIDPGDRVSVGRGASWRIAVSEGLAATIARAQGQASPPEIVEFALQRLRLDDIDPIGWRASGGEGVT